MEAFSFNMSNFNFVNKNITKQRLAQVFKELFNYIEENQKSVYRVEEIITTLNKIIGIFNKNKDSIHEFSSSITDAMDSINTIITQQLEPNQNDADEDEKQYIQDQINALSNQCSQLQGLCNENKPSDKNTRNHLLETKINKLIQSKDLLDFEEQEISILKELEKADEMSRHLHRLHSTIIVNTILNSERLNNFLKNKVTEILETHNTIDDNLIIKELQKEASKKEILQELNVIFKSHIIPAIKTQDQKYFDKIFTNENISLIDKFNDVLNRLNLSMSIDEWYNKYANVSTNHLKNSALSSKTLLQCFCYVMSAMKDKQEQEEKAKQKLELMKQYREDVTEPKAFYNVNIGSTVESTLSANEAVAKYDKGTTYRLTIINDEALYYDTATEAINEFRRLNNSTPIESVTCGYVYFTKTEGGVISNVSIESRVVGTNIKDGDIKESKLPESPYIQYQAFKDSLKMIKTIQHTLQPVNFTFDIMTESLEYSEEYETTKNNLTQFFRHNYIFKNIYSQYDKYLPQLNSIVKKFNDDNNTFYNTDDLYNIIRRLAMCNSPQEIISFNDNDNSNNIYKMMQTVLETNDITQLKPSYIDILNIIKDSNKSFQSVDDVLQALNTALIQQSKNITNYNDSINAKKQELIQKHKENIEKEENKLEKWKDTIYETTPYGKKITNIQQVEAEIKHNEGIDSQNINNSRNRNGRIDEILKKMITKILNFYNYDINEEEKLKLDKVIRNIIQEVNNGIYSFIYKNQKTATKEKIYTETNKLIENKINNEFEDNDTIRELINKLKSVYKDYPIVGGYKISNLLQTYKQKQQDLNNLKNSFSIGRSMQTMSNNILNYTQQDSLIAQVGAMILKNKQIDEKTKEELLQYIYTHKKNDNLFTQLSTKISSTKISKNENIDKEIKKEFSDNISTYQQQTELQIELINQLKTACSQKFNELIKELINTIENNLNELNENTINENIQNKINYYLPKPIIRKQMNINAILQQYGYKIDSNRDEIDQLCEILNQNKKSTSLYTLIQISKAILNELIRQEGPQADPYTNPRIKKLSDQLYKLNINSNIINDITEIQRQFGNDYEFINKFIKDMKAKIKDHKSKRILDINDNIKNIYQQKQLINNTYELLKQQVSQITTKSTNKVYKEILRKLDYVIYSINAIIKNIQSIITLYNKLFQIVDKDEKNNNNAITNNFQKDLLTTNYETLINTIHNAKYTASARILIQLDKPYTGHKFTCIANKKKN